MDLHIHRPHDARCAGGQPGEGFLPPDNTSDAGEGFVTYTVAPKSTDTTGTLIDAKATVTFQAGLPDQSSLDTAPISNTIDAGAPTSSVAALPASSPSIFTVLWSGHDDTGGSGIASFDIFVSDNGGPFTAWLTGTQTTSATYTGQDGHTYAFYSVATDNVGHVQATPATAQADHHGPRRPADETHCGLGRRHLWRDGHADGHADCRRRAPGGTDHQLHADRRRQHDSGRYRDDRQRRRRDPEAREPGRPTRRFCRGAVGASFAGDASDAPTSASGNLDVAAPPAPVTVLSAGWQTRKLSKKKTTKVLVINFSGALDPNAARMLGDYQLATVVKAKKSRATRARRWR